VDVLVDGNPSPVEHEPGESLGTALERLEAVLARDGRVIVAVEAAGDELTPPRRQDLAGANLADLCPVRIVTARPLEAAAEILRGLAGALPTLQAEQERAAAALQAGQRAQAMSVFRGCIEVWQQIQGSVLKVAALIRPALDEEAHEVARLTEASEALRDALAGVREALENDDPTALSDVIEADLAPLTGQWRQVLTLLADRADAAQQSGP